MARKIIMYAEITIVVFSILSVLAAILYKRKKKREMEKKLRKKWENIQKDASALYYMLHYSVKDLISSKTSLGENPVMVDLLIDMEKLEKPSDARRLYSIAVSIYDDLLKLSSVLAEYRLYMRDDVVSVARRLVEELEEFISMESVARRM